jgi:hypothetical protein
LRKRKGEGRQKRVHKMVSEKKGERRRRRGRGKKGKNGKEGERVLGFMVHVQGWSIVTINNLRKRKGGG